MIKSVRVLRCTVADATATTTTTTSTKLMEPFPTEGGGVPIWSMANGRIAKHNWVVNDPKWCTLCKEPISAVDHANRKDHSLMDLHYRHHVDFPRNWNPVQVLGSFATELGVPIETYQRKASYYDQRRRSEIFAMVSYLAAEGVISVGNPRNSFLWRCQGGFRGMDHQGALLLHEYMVPTFLRLYPDAQIGDLSNLIDFISCGYNMETVYDVCAFYELDRIDEKKLKASSPAALGLGGIASSSSATSGYDSSTGDSPTLDASKVQSDEEYEADFSRKAQFIRSILGQLRWVTQREVKEHPQGKKIGAHFMHIADNLCKLLIAETIVCRIVEYMVRTEPVWVETGMQRRKLEMTRVMKLRSAPRPITSFFRKMEGNLDDYYTLKLERQSKLEKQEYEEAALVEQLRSTKNLKGGLASEDQSAVDAQIWHHLVKETSSPYAHLVNFPYTMEAKSHHRNKAKTILNERVVPKEEQDAGVAFEAKLRSNYDKVFAAEQSAADKKKAAEAKSRKEVMEKIKALSKYSGRRLKPSGAGAADSH